MAGAYHRLSRTPNSVGQRLDRGGLRLSMNRANDIVLVLFCLWCCVRFGTRRHK